MRRVIAAAGVVAVALSLSGCGLFDGLNTAEANATAAPSDSSGNSGSQADPDQSAPTKSTNAKFGQTFAYTDGLSVTVSTPADFVPGQYASGAVAGEKALAFTVTIANGTKDNFDPSSFYETLSSGGKESEPIFDDSQGITLPPQTPILPGKSINFNIAFSVADPTDVTMDVQPDDHYKYQDIIFTLGQ